MGMVMVHNIPVVAFATPQFLPSDKAAKGKKETEGEMAGGKHAKRIREEVEGAILW